MAREKNPAFSDGPDDGSNVAVVDFPDQPGDDNYEEPTEGDDRKPSSLGEAAQTALTGTDGDTPFEGMEDQVKIRFTGMSMDSLDESPKLGEEMVFKVRARCIGVGEEALKTGTIRQYARMDVQSVILETD